ncbi:MAG: hypothetical protein Q6363_003225, partial [Candidatus Njordarchaeota archaeon]
YIAFSMRFFGEISLITDAFFVMKFYKKDIIIRKATQLLVLSLILSMINAIVLGYLLDRYRKIEC